MSKPISRRNKRTYFNNPLVMESLHYLPAALEHPTTETFKKYLVEHLHHNSESTRVKASEYIAGRFAVNGAMDLVLASALRKFGESRISSEIFYFEYQRAIPVLQEIAVRWLSELPREGGDRAGLLSFIETVYAGKSSGKIAQSAVQAFKNLGKLESPKMGVYLPVWGAPPLEAFLYVLAKLYEEPSMVRVESFSSDINVRAMLWPANAIPELLQAAEHEGHISKVTKLDQYHQFTLAGTGRERMQKLLGALPDNNSPLSTSARKMPGSGKKQKMGDGPKNGQQMRLL